MFMLVYDEKWSNLLLFVRTVCKEVFSLFLGIIVKKMRNPQVLMQRKALGMIFKEEKRSNDVWRTKRARLKSPKWCTVSRALRHNYVETD